MGEEACPYAPSGCGPVYIRDIIIVHVDRYTQVCYFYTDANEDVLCLLTTTIMIHMMHRTFNELTCPEKSRSVSRVAHEESILRSRSHCAIHQDKYPIHYHIYHSFFYLVCHPLFLI